MDRRTLITRAGGASLGALAGAALARPALAQTAPRIAWRCRSAGPAGSATAFGAAERLAAAVREASDGAFDIRVVSQDDATLGRDAVEAVQAGEAEMCHTSPAFSRDHGAIHALAGGLPFGLNPRGKQAWLARGGTDMLNAAFAADGLHYLPGGSTGTPLAGWFRREIAVPADLKGLRIQCSGLSRRVLERLGAVPASLAPSGVVAALRADALDAAEGSAPLDDEARGLTTAAPYCCYPGWSGGGQRSFFIAKPAFDSLPPAFRGLLVSAARAVAAETLAFYDHDNPAALKRLVEAGAQLRPVPQVVLDALFAAARDVAAEIAAADPAFRAIHAAMTAFRGETFLYQQLSDYTFDTYMMIQQREGSLRTEKP